ncbi:MAG TPA: riboflavin synthase [Bryobacteraceae bacterium]|nr:riboflavin synthase [Bryobacteraceae bacterium]
MFTGIVEEVGTIGAVRRHDAGARVEINCKTVMSDATLGASIAVNGTCVTMIAIGEDGFAADLSPETLERTSLGGLGEGSLVNLERPLLLSTRIGGHLVQGHVDGTGEYVSIAPLGDDNWWLSVRSPRELDRYMIHKGSITLDGISLTIAKLEGSIVSVAIIPHTYEHTALRGSKPGDRVNIEVDMIAKYVEKLLPPRESA